MLASHSHSQILLEKQRWGLVFWETFLVTWGGPYFCNCISNLELEFLMPLCMWTTIPPHLKKLKMAAQLVKKGCETSFHYLQFSSKYNHSPHVMKVKFSVIWLVISVPRSASPHLPISVPRSAPPHVPRNGAQNTRLSSHMWRVWAHDYQQVSYGVFSLYSVVQSYTGK